MSRISIYNILTVLSSLSFLGVNYSFGYLSAANISLVLLGISLSLLWERSAVKLPKHNIVLLMFIVIALFRLPFGGGVSEVLVYVNIIVLYLALLFDESLIISRVALIISLLIIVLSMLLSLVLGYQDASTPVAFALLLAVPSGLAFLDERPVLRYSALVFMGVLVESRSLLLVGCIFLFRHLLKQSNALLFLIPASLMFVLFDGLGILFEMIGGGDNTTFFGLNVNTAGRAYVWEKIYSDHITLIGEGISLPLELKGPRWNHPHNEFLRVLLIWGVLGLLVFIDLIRKLYIKCMSRGKGNLFFVLFVFSFFDNWLVFTFANILFLIILNQKTNVSYQRYT